MKHIIKHSLPLPLAKMATQKAFESYEQRFSEYSPTAEWVSDERAEISFSALGKTLRGAIELRASEIGLELDVPLMMRPFKNKALGVIEEQIQQWVARAQDGELDG